MADSVKTSVVGGYLPAVQEGAITPQADTSLADTAWHSVAVSGQVSALIYLDYPAYVAVDSNASGPATNNGAVLTSGVTHKIGVYGHTKLWLKKVSTNATAKVSLVSAASV